MPIMLIILRVLMISTLIVMSLISRHDNGHRNLDIHSRITAVNIKLNMGNTTMQKNKGDQHGRRRAEARRRLQGQAKA